MKIQIISDLHIDFSKYKFINEENADVLIIAGDSGNGAIAINSFYKQHIVNKWKYIILIPGNHEWYKGTIRSNRIKKQHSSKTRMNCFEKFAEEHENFYFLQDESVVLDGIKFYGGTMWTSINNQNPVDIVHVTGAMNDYNYLTISEIDYMHKNFMYNLPTDADVVISHHAPSELSISEKFKGSPLNVAYYEELFDLIYESNYKLWVHGHVHNSVDYMINNTNVVCNPKGYTRSNGQPENIDFNTQLIKEIIL